MWAEANGGKNRIWPHNRSVGFRAVITEADKNQKIEGRSCSSSRPWAGRGERFASARPLALFADACIGVREAHTEVRLQQFCDCCFPPLGRKKYFDGHLYVKTTYHTSEEHVEVQDNCSHFSFHYFQEFLLGATLLAGHIVPPERPIFICFHGPLPLSLIHI